MPSTRKRLARGRRAVMAAFAGAVLVLTAAQVPAHADESNWSSYDGNQARVRSGVYSVTIGGASYEVARGTDDNVWFRYNGGSWNQLNGDPATRTTSPPRIIEFPPGRAMTVVRGLDGEIWYSQVNNGALNSWTPWTRLPAGANAIGSPLLTLSPATGALMIEVPNANRVLSYTFLNNYPGGLTSYGWTVDNHVLLGTNATDLEGDSQIAIYGTEYYNSVLRNFITGSDHRVWRETLNPSTGAVLHLEEVNGGAECTTGVAAAHLGSQTTVVAPGQTGFAEQQRVLIACVGNDGYVWESMSSDGGLTFDGWRHPSGTLAPSVSTPAIAPTPFSSNTWTLNVRWNGARDSLFPGDSIVAKVIR
ncbi:hypothetical protein ACFVTF_21285 [Kitasatospora sp. NPDC057940]|uniref:hypothetical protein n=1 Tax=Kitasatospora sp. NPDC057940 TaxID=3346285 RepID=UPI0036DBB599